MQFGLDLLWKSQENSLLSITKSKVTAISQFNCFAATIRFTGQRIFICEIKSETDTSDFKPSKFRGIEIQIMEPPDENVKWLVVCLLDLRLFELFCYLCIDLIKGIRQADTEKALLETIFRIIGLWKTFFEKVRPSGLSDEQQKGLYGELFFISALIQSGVKAETALICWQGPDAKNQDFIHPDVSAEIKTTAANHPVLNITNEHQLDQEGSFVIVHVVLTERQGTDNTLVTIIRDLSKIFESVSAEYVAIFQSKLLKTGYYSEDEELYNNITYDIRYIRAYEVRKGFPRITPASLPPGVFSVSYLIETSACLPYTVDFPSYITEILQNGNSK